MEAKGESKSDANALMSYIKQGLKYNGFFGKFEEINHISMLMNSIYQFNGTENHFHEFFERYIDEYSLQKIPSTNIQPQNQMDLSNWSKCFGKRSEYVRFSLFFQQSWEQLGRKGFLKKYLSVFHQNPSCGFFHPLIQLGHCNKFEDMVEISNAFATWASCYFENPVKSAKGPLTRQLISVFDKLRESRDMQALEFNTGTLEYRVNSLIMNNKFQQLMPQFENSEEALREMIVDVCQLYRAKPCFATQHLIEACESLRSVLMMINSAHDFCDEFVSNFFTGICAAYIVIGCPKVEKLTKSTFASLPPWNEIYSEALKSKDEHTLLFIYSCSKLYFGYHNYYPIQITKYIAAKDLNLSKIE